jgi:ABC-type transporter Mla subunit MlaD
VKAGEMTGAGQFVRSAAALLSVCGALIIFFSWVLTNTRAQTLSRIKQAVESAQSTFRLYTTLHELRDQLNSVAMEVIEGKTSPNATQLASGRTGRRDEDSVRATFDKARLSAHQIKELMDFTAETNSFSRAVGSATPASDEIGRILTEVDHVYTPLRESERQVEDLLHDSRVSLDDAREAVKRYNDYVRNTAIPQVPSLYRRVVELSNRRRDEGDRELDTARQKAEFASSVSRILYVFGSVLALGGQFIDKFLVKR